jgi:hypothetical protein
VSKITFEAAPGPLVNPGQALSSGISGDFNSGKMSTKKGKIKEDKYNSREKNLSNEIQINNRREKTKN